jgi:hypothetical protein
MTPSIRLKLILMMVLEFFIWGAWYPLIFGYLPSLGFTPASRRGSSARSRSRPSSACSSATSSPTAISPRRRSSVSHLIAGAAMIALFWTHAFWPFFGFMLIHCLLYVPTISITNSIAFTHMKDAQKEFGIVRMGGTIGWIMAAWPMTFILVDWDHVGAAQTSGFVDWLGTVLGSGLTGPALQTATR